MFTVSKWDVTDEAITSRVELQARPWNAYHGIRHCGHPRVAESVVALFPSLPARNGSQNAVDGEMYHMEWQLIETAPKDGTWVLAFESPNMRVVRWGSVGVHLFSGRSGDERWNDGEYDFAPTHWMPLPEPPK
jgi:hypothetical protein